MSKPKRNAKKPLPPAKKPTPTIPATPPRAPETTVGFHQAAFLAAYRTCCSVRRAAEAAHIARTLHYQWLRDHEYAKRFAEAQEDAAQVLEDEAVRRAYEGNLEPVFYQGEHTEDVLRYSDALLMFLLRGLRPKRYRERTELSGPDGGPLQIDIVERLNAARNRLAAQSDAK